MSDRTRIDRLAADVAAVREQLHAVANSPQGQRTSIEGGAIEFNDEDGNLKAIVGGQDDGGYTTNVISGPTPPTPASFNVETDFGKAVVHWFGDFEDSLIAPSYWARTEVYAQPGQFIVPSRENARGSFVAASGGEVVVGLQKGQWTFCLVAWSQAGKMSQMSDPVTVDIPGYGDIVLDEIDTANTLIKNAGDLLLEGQKTLDEKLAEAMSGGGGSTSYFEDRAPTADDPGKLGDNWFYGYLDSLSRWITQAQFSHDGTGWKSVVLSHEAIASVDVGSLVAGSAAIKEAVIDKLFTEVVVARMVQADEFIGENAILTGAVTASKITASEELWAKLGQFVKIRAEQLEADAIDGMTITGPDIYTSHTGARVHLGGIGLEVFNPDDIRTLYASTSTGNVEMIGDLYTNSEGNERVWLTNSLWNSIRVEDEDGNYVGNTGGAGIRIGKNKYSAIDMHHATRAATSGELIDVGMVSGPSASQYGDFAVVELGSAKKVDGPWRTWGLMQSVDGSGNRTSRVGAYSTGNKASLQSFDSSQNMTAAVTTYGTTGIIRLDGTYSATYSTDTQPHRIHYMGPGYDWYMSFGRGGNDPYGYIGSPGAVGSTDFAVMSDAGKDLILTTGGSSESIFLRAHGDDVFEARDDDGSPLIVLKPLAYKTTSASANVYSSGGGGIRRVKSSARYKDEIAPKDLDAYADSLLDLDFKTWIDKGEAARYERFCQWQNQVTGPPTQEWAESMDEPTLHAGLIAEEVAASGNLDELIEFDQFGRPEAVNYDRVGPALIPIVRELRERITQLEKDRNG